MGVTYFPFNSRIVGGQPDRAANADVLALYLKTFFTSGVALLKSAALQVNASAGLTVQIEPGTAFLDGRILHSDSVELFTLDDAEINMDRIDRIVFRLDYVNRLMEFDVLKGEPGSNPMPPELKRDADAWEMCLAEVYVKALVTEITQSNITDTRANSDVCGIVVSTIQELDTATFYKQYEEQFEKAFEDVANGDFVTITAFNNAMAEKEAAAVYMEMTMAAASWDANTKTYSFEGLYPSENYNIWVQPVKPCTAKQLEAWGGAMLMADPATNILTALGAVPTVDIPVIVRAVRK